MSSVSHADAAAPVGAGAEADAPVARRVRGSLVNSASGLIASAGAYLVIGRFVAPAEYGRASIILALWGFSTVAVDWCGILVMRYGPVELQQHGTLRRTLSTRLVFAAPALALMLPGAPLYLALSHGWPMPLLLLTAVYLLMSATFGIVQWGAIAAQRFSALAIANAIMRSAPPLLVLTFVATGRAVTAQALTVATVAGTILGVLILGVALRPLLGLVRPDRALLGTMWRYSVPLLFAAPAVAARTYIDPLILGRSASHAEVGCYQLAYLTVTLFGALGGSLTQVLSPELVRAAAQDRAAVLEHYRRHQQPRMAIGLGLCAFAGAFLVAPLVRAILPASWAPAADTAAILTVAGGLLLGVWSYHPLATVTDSVWALQLSSTAAGATNVVLDVLLAPRWGATGVALANVAAWAIELVVLALLLHRRVGARRVTLVPLLLGAALVLPALVARASR
jgi:PST family polysaccharide transporter